MPIPQRLTRVKPGFNSGFARLFGKGYYSYRFKLPGSPHYPTSGDWFITYILDAPCNRPYMFMIWTLINMSSSVTQVCYHWFVKFTSEVLHYNCNVMHSIKEYTLVPIERFFRSCDSVWYVYTCLNWSRWLWVHVGC